MERIPFCEVLGVGLVAMQQAWGTRTELGRLATRLPADEQALGVCAFGAG